MNNTSLKISIGIFFICSVGVSFLLGMIFEENSSYKEPVVIERPTFTGYDIWNAANLYRESQDKQDMILDPYLCNNIAARVVNYEKTNSHDGLEEFKNQSMPKVYVLAEILNHGNSVDEIIKGWSGSPSHNILLLGKKRGCAYANNGDAVILMAD